MRKFTSLMLMLLCAVTTWAGDFVVSTTEGTPENIYTINNGNGIFVAGNGANGEMGKFAFYAVEGKENAYYIYSVSESKWFTYDQAESYGGQKNFVKLSDNKANYFHIAHCTNNSTCYEIRPYKSNGETFDIFLNWYGGTDGSPLGLWTQNGDQDPGSRMVIWDINNYPTANKFYVIEAPLFQANQGISKGLYVNSENSPAWNTIDLTDKAYYWTIEINEGGKFALKNVGTGKYLNGTTISDEVVYGDIVPLTEMQFNIKINGTVHANNHGNGNNASGNIVDYSAGLNSASAWKFIEREDPDAVKEVVVKYEFIYNEEVKYTQEITTLVGEQYPAINTAFPFGIKTNDVVPAEKISADDIDEGSANTITKQFALTIELPFTYFDSYNDINVWYFMNIRDDGPTYMYYNSEKNYIPAIQSSVPVESKDAYSWAFIGNPFDGFKIVNKAAGANNILSAPVAPTGNKNENEIARMVVAENATGNTIWNFKNPTHNNAAANSFYMEHPTNTNYAFNRQSYNGENAVCYWNGRDTGSAIQVVERETENAVLEALIESANEIVENNNPAIVGHYTSNAITSLEAEIAKANETIKGIAELEDVVALQNAINNLEIVYPSNDKFYTIKSVYFANNYMYVDQNNNYKCGTGNNANNVFQIISKDGKHIMKNVATGSYLKDAYKQEGWGIAYATQNGTIDNAVSITIESLAQGIVAFVPVNTENNAATLHAQGGNGGNIVGWENNEANGKSAWLVEEVESFSHTLTVGTAGYSTLCLGFNAAIPAGVECYVVSEIDENNCAQLTQITGVLPANTPVIVKADASTYTFTSTAETATKSQNLLQGTLYRKEIADNSKTYYILANGDNGVGLYPHGTEEHGNFVNNANKAYLPVENEQAAISYGFNFGGTTAIEGIEAVAGEQAIYDLTGRKIEAITAPGLYIINGVKTIVE